MSLDSSDILVDSVVPDAQVIIDPTPEIEALEIDDSVAISETVSKKKPSSNIPTSSLPLSRVKKILKLDPDINIVTADAVKLVAYCTVGLPSSLSFETYIKLT